MQFAYNIKKVTMSGTSFAGAEIWSTGFYVGAVGADCSNPTQAFADAVRTAWTTFWQHLDTDINSGWKTNEIKVAQISAEGETDEANVVYAPYGTPIAGSNNGLIYPPQIDDELPHRLIPIRGILLESLGDDAEPSRVMFRRFRHEALRQPQRQQVIHHERQPDALFAQTLEKSTLPRNHQGA